MKILILEDDKLFNETLEDFLDEEGFEVFSALDPYTALDLSYEQKFDCYLFDVNLPYESGFDLLEKLRQSGDKTPTIFLTSYEDKEFLCQGFRVGADDYMKKPIDLDELLFRIHALLRREFKYEKMLVGEYIIDMGAKQIYYEGKSLQITVKAVELLLLLLRSEGEVVSMSSIEEHLWHTDEEVSLGAIRVYITKLKKYFPCIENVRGVGYRYRAVT